MKPYQPTGSIGSAGKESIWDNDEMPQGIKKVRKSMKHLGVDAEVGVMDRRFGKDLNPAQRAWRPSVN